jgi:hypothetical protein
MSFVSEFTRRALAADESFLKGRAARATNREAAAFAATVEVGSRWYASDRSFRFYLFSASKVGFSSAWMAFEKMPTTIYGTTAEQAYRIHGGRLTDRRPSGWMSAATRSLANYGGWDGGPADWESQDNPDLDLDVAAAIRLRKSLPSASVRGSLRDF